MVDDDCIAFINRFFRSTKMKVTKRDFAVVVGTFLVTWLAPKGYRAVRGKKSKPASKAGKKKSSSKKAA